MSEPTFDSAPILGAFGSRVLSLREARSLTQQALADQTGLSREYISRVESGQRNPSLGVLARLAESFGLSLSELLVDL